MANQTDEQLIDKYDWISTQLTRYLGLVLYILCWIGSMMNIVTFLQQMYHSRAASLYLLLASSCDLVHLSLDPLSNILQYGFHYHWTITSLGFCRTKSYFAFVFTITSGTLTTLASISQYLLSSEKSSYWYYARRHIGIRYAKLTFFIWLCLSIPIIFCTERHTYLLKTTRSICSNPARHIHCYAVQLIYICLFNGFVPPVIMTSFGYLTHRNVRQLRRRSKTKSIRIRRINQQLASMLILQSIKSTMASIPYSIFNCYWLKTMYDQKSLVRQAREDLLHQMVYLLFWSNYTSFFVYLYSSDIFRDQWMIAMKRCLCWRQRRKSREQFDWINRRNFPL